MGRFDERLRRLERRFRERGPTLEEVSVAFEQVAGYARATLHGESVDEDRRARDRATVDRWTRAEGVDLSVEVERAREKLKTVG